MRRRARLSRSLRVRLPVREGRGDRGYAATGLEDARDRRIGREVEALVALRVHDLRHEAAIGEAGHIAVAEPAGISFAREPPLDRLEAQPDPMVEPGLDGLLVLAKGTGEIAEHAEIVDRVDVAGNRLGQ